MTNVLCPATDIYDNMQYIFIDSSGNYVAEHGSDMITTPTINDSCYFTITPKDDYYTIKSHSGQYLCEQNSLPQWTSSEANASAFRFSFQNGEAMIQLVGTATAQSSYLRTYNQTITLGSKLNDFQAHFQAYTACPGYNMHGLDPKEKMKLYTFGGTFIGDDDINYYVELFDKEEDSSQFWIDENHALRIDDSYISIEDNTLRTCLSVSDVVDLLCTCCGYVFSDKNGKIFTYSDSDKVFKLSDNPGEICFFDMQMDSPLTELDTPDTKFQAMSMDDCTIAEIELVYTVIVGALIMIGLPIYMKDAQKAGFLALLRSNANVNTAYQNVISIANVSGVKLFLLAAGVTQLFNAIYQAGLLWKTIKLLGSTLGYYTLGKFVVTIMEFMIPGAFTAQMIANGAIYLVQTGIAVNDWKKACKK